MQIYMNIRRMLFPYGYRRNNFVLRNHPLYWGIFKGHRSPNPQSFRFTETDSQPTMNSLVVIAVCALALCLQSAQALTYGGGACTFATSGVAACTATANGFCSVDTVTVTGSPVTAVAVTGKCICYPNFSGTVCGTQTVTSTSTTTASSNNALGVLALGALAAAALSGFGSGSSSGLGGSGDLTGTDLLYLQQAQQFQG